MAITVSSRPSEYSNSSIFVTTTDLVEDSTHVNLRLEASLYVDGVVIAKKVKPKGITTFDFTEILRSKCLCTIPALDDDVSIPITDSGKIGSNLITGWTNDGFDTHTTTGANWTSLVTNNNAKTYTNTIAVTAGLKYVILFKSTTCESAFSIQVKTTPANGNIIVDTDGTTKRMYFEARTTGNIQLEFVVISASPTYNYAGNWEMFLLNTNNWFTSYYVSFTEKYEDAAGVTQTGATSTESTLNLFFLSNATTFSSYICYDVNGKFMEPDGNYISGIARSYPILKTPASGERFSIFQSWILDKRLYQDTYRVLRYNSAGTLLDTSDGTLRDRYAPIKFIQYNSSLVTVYPIGEIIILKATDTVCSESLRYKAINTCFPENIHLIWRNNYGGFSEHTFSYGIEKEQTTEKEYYRDVNRKNKVIPTSIVNINTVRAQTALGLSDDMLTYISEILSSKQVYWQRAADDLVEVTIMSDTIKTKEDYNFTPFQIEFTW